MATRIPDPSPEALAAARQLYSGTNIPVETIAASLAMRPRTFHARRREWGWPSRAAGARPAGSAVVAPEMALAEPVPFGAGLAALALRLERRVARRLDRLEAEAAAGRDRDPDGTDRRLLQLERLLAQLGKRRGQDGSLDELGPPARSVAELRDELLRHLEAVRQSGRRRTLRRRPEPG
jgi:HAMP domain-containing protein